jgi:hypothetical protein
MFGTEANRCGLRTLAHGPHMSSSFFLPLAFFSIASRVSHDRRPCNPALRCSLLYALARTLCGATTAPKPLRRATRCRQRTLEVCPELASLPQEGPGGLPQIPYAHPRGPTPDSDTLEGPPYSPTVVVLLELIHGGPLELHLESSP